MKFKKLEIEQEGSWFRRLIGSSRFKKSIMYIIAGGILGFVFTYLSEGFDLSLISSKEIFANMLTGAFIGLFITNSPCARNRC